MWTGALCPGPCTVLVLRIMLSQDRHFQNCCHPHRYIDLSQLDSQRAAGPFLPTGTGVGKPSSRHAALSLVSQENGGTTPIPGLARGTTVPLRDVSWSLCSHTA